MNKYSLLVNILNRPWAIDIDHAAGCGAIVHSILNSRLESEPLPEPEANKPSKIIAASQDSNIKNSQNGAVMVIPIIGELMKYDEFCGPAGMQTIGKRIQKADKDPDVGSIMLMFDTPGGSVDGIKDLADIIKGTQKTITSYITGMCASGGMWLASCTDKIIASQDTDYMGSIGVMTSFWDMVPYYEALGFKFHEVYSSLSKDKNRDFAELRAGKYENYIKEVLDPLATDFRETIKTNRPNVTENQLTGKMFFAKQLMGTLVDEIAGFDKAIQITADMATKKLHIKSNLIDMKKLEQLSVVLEVEELISTEEGIFLSEDQAETIENTLAGHSASLNEIMLERDAAKEITESVKTELEELKKENARLTELVETMKGQPAEKAAAAVTSSNAVKADDDACVTSASNDFEENVRLVGQSFLNKKQ